MLPYFSLSYIIGVQNTIKCLYFIFFFVHETKLEEMLSLKVFKVISKLYLCVGIWKRLQKLLSVASDWDNKVKWRSGWTMG